MSRGWRFVPNLFATRVNVDTAVAYCSKSNGSPCSARALRSVQHTADPRVRVYEAALDGRQSVDSAEVRGYAVDDGPEFVRYARPAV